MNKPDDSALQAARLAPASAPRTGRRALWITLLVLVLASAGGGWWWWQSREPAATPPGAPGAPGARRPGGPPDAIPVGVATAKLGDIPLRLDGLGTVTPLRTVTVRSRVEGQLLRVLFEEGQMVKQGDLLAEIDPRPFQAQLAQAEGTTARDRALLENARRDLERYETLFKQDSIARQQVDTQAALVRQYEGTAKINEGAIESIRLNLTYARITAPISGRVGLRQVDPGNMIGANDANGIVVITQLEPISVLFTLPQDSLPAVMKRVRAGEKLPVEAWDREQKLLLDKGQLVSVDNQIDPQTGTVKLRAQFANATAALFPQQFVNIRMQLDTLKDAVLIPSAAVQRGAQGLFVYVVKDDSTVTLRPVKLGATQGATVAVAEGVAAGDTVVIDGIDRLREGARVERIVRDGARVDDGPRGERRRSGKPPADGAPGGGLRGGPPR
jgi:multidrug efflux system membrane fusion protein